MIVDRLRDRQLTFLIKPFKQMVEQDKSGEIKIHKMTWKIILREFYNEHATRNDLSKVLVAYLVNFGIAVVKKKRTDPRSSKERVKSHREHKKVLGYKQLSVLLSVDDLERLKRFKRLRGMTYQDAFEFMINKLPVTRDADGKPS